MSRLAQPLSRRLRATLWAVATSAALCGAGPLIASAATTPQSHTPAGSGSGSTSAGSGSTGSGSGSAGGGDGKTPRGSGPLSPAAAHRLLRSPELWTTIDVCNPKSQPNTIGIRGSMPGDGLAKDTMYMRFTVQYYDLTARRWTSIGQGGDSGFVMVGSAGVARQAGRSFQFAANASKLVFRMRGVVYFQWRRGATVLLEATRPSTAGHTSLAGADPPGYTEGTCKMD